MAAEEAAPASSVAATSEAAGHGGAGGAPEDDRTVVFVSNDNEEFEVPMAVVRMSEFAMMQAGGEEDDDDDDGDKTRVYLPNVKGRVLARIVEWCKLHVDDPFPEVSRPIPRPNMRDAGVSEADEEWVNALSYKELNEILQAANFMQVRDLLTLCALRIALWFKGKTPEEIKAKFGITRDFTPEEEEEVRERYKWAERLAPVAP